MIKANFIVFYLLVQCTDIDDIICNSNGMYCSPKSTNQRSCIAKYLLRYGSFFSTFVHSFYLVFYRKDDIDDFGS